MVGVGLGAAVSVKYGIGVKVSGSVGADVAVENVGTTVTPGVIVGTLGTHSRSPGKMKVEFRQLPACSAVTVVW
jgi:hypothetical protein